MQREAPGPAELVKRLGPHPAARLGIDLASRSTGAQGQSDDALWSWLVAACLLSDRLDEARVATALGALARAGLADAAPLGEAGPVRAAAALAEAGHPHAERRGAQLARAARRLGERWQGSLERLAAGALDLEELGGALAALAPGIGAATVRRFLEPLRERWPGADALPLSAAARAAAHHVGLAPGAGEDEATWQALRGALGPSPDAPALADLEAALARLGTRACLRDRPARCPLAESCPRARSGGTA